MYVEISLSEASKQLSLIVLMVFNLVSFRGLFRTLCFATLSAFDITLNNYD